MKSSLEACAMTNMDSQNAGSMHAAPNDDMQICIAHCSSSDRVALSLNDLFDRTPVPTLVIDCNHVVKFWNKACEEMTRLPAAEMLGTSDHWKAFYKEKQPLLADRIIDGSTGSSRCAGDPAHDFSPSFLDSGYNEEFFFPDMGKNGTWIYASASPLRDASGKVVAAIEMLQDISRQKFAEIELQKVLADMEILVSKRTEQLADSNSRLQEDIRKREEAESELRRRNAELVELNERFTLTQEKLIQSEKLASIGQLAAGVAHEINNPIGYIFSNFGSLETYISNLLTMLDAYEEAESSISSNEVRAKLLSVRERIELDYVKEDIPVLLNESKEGIVRVRKIVQDLKDFSHVDAHQEWQWTNLHQGIDSTLNIVSNEVKYKADVVREYGEIPEIECLASQINQVIMNLIVNAAHAISGPRGKITIRTGCLEDKVWIEVEDTGSGIPADLMPRIFDPFFTTKPVGSGTGLGLSLSYGIIQKHRGTIEVQSEVGHGTCFRITLPVRHEPQENME
ncbi:MAG: ATP-binding protein [Burkholderiaceae bacterium]